MEIIDLSGYVAEEKLVIAQKYLIPQVAEMTGLNPTESGSAEAGDIQVTESGLNFLIKVWTVEKNYLSQKLFTNFKAGQVILLAGW